jgi:hypothetical protein
VKIRQFLVALPVLAAVLFSGAASAAEHVHRTFDKLNVEEMDALSKVTHEYYRSVANKVATITGADATTPSRIMATYPERIKIIRQQSRIRLLNVEKILYAMNLNPEFIVPLWRVKTPAFQAAASAFLFLYLRQLRGLWQYVISTAFIRDLLIGEADIASFSCYSKPPVSAGGTFTSSRQTPDRSLPR